MKGWWTRVALTNSTPFNDEELIEWSGGGLGVVRHDGYLEAQPRLLFKYAAGPDVDIGTVVTGQVTGAQREITAFTFSPAVLSLSPQGSSAPSGSLTAVEWTCDVQTYHSALTQQAIDYPSATFRFLWTFMSVSGTAFLAFKNRKPDSGDPDVIDAMLTPYSLGVGRAMEWNTQFSGFWKLKTTSDFFTFDHQEPVTWDGGGVGKVFRGPTTNWNLNTTSPSGSFTLGETVTWPGGSGKHVGDAAGTLTVSYLSGDPPGVSDVVSGASASRTVASFGASTPPLDLEIAYISGPAPDVGDTIVGGTNGGEFAVTQVTPPLQDGLLRTISTSTPPRYCTLFNNFDNLGLVGKSFNHRDEMPVPSTHVFRAQLVGFETDPAGNLAQNLLGEWIPIFGDYAKWSVSDNGVQVGILYLPKAQSETLQTKGMSLTTEHFTQFPNTGPNNTRLTDNPMDIRYHGCRVFDSAAGRWHELLHWEITHSEATPDPDFGYSVFTVPGAITHLAGFASASGEQRGRDDVDASGALVNQGANILRALTYEDGSGVPLIYQGNHVQEEPAGAITHIGPKWHKSGGGTPFIKQDSSPGRGFYVLHPGVSLDAVCVYTAPHAGDYRFIGDFARANSSASGNGVDVSVRQGTTIWFTDTILQTEAGDVLANEDTPFASASNRNFTVDVPLTAGERIEFRVSARSGDAGFDSTAFRLTEVSFQQVSEDPPGEVSASTVSLFHEFLGPDVLLEWVEPDFSGEFTPDESADLNSGLDPLVRDFELQAFDPATGTILRTERGITQREYRYTRAMNGDDQSRVLARGPQRDLGFRVRMNSVTNRTSAWSTLAVRNPLPVVPSGMTLSSSPGDSNKGSDAVVHCVLTPGDSKADPDFLAFAVWADTTPGFTPSPSNFKGMSAQGSNTVLFPASSGTIVYVRAGALDAFHPQPELLSDPLLDVALMAEQSVATIDAASLPIDTSGIVPRAVTDFFSAATPTGGITVGTSDVSLVALNVLGAEEKIAIFGAASFTGTFVNHGKIGGAVCRVERRAQASIVLFYDASLDTFTDITTEAFTSTTGDIPLPEATGDQLYIGSRILYGYDVSLLSGPELRFIAGAAAGSTTTLIGQYLSNAGWEDMTGVTDSTGGFRITGVVSWDVALDWSANLFEGEGPYFWTRWTRATFPSPVGTGTQLLLRQRVDFSDGISAPPDFFNSSDQPQGTNQQHIHPPSGLTAVSAGTISPVETLETIVLVGNASLSCQVRQATLMVIAGKR